MTAARFRLAGGTDVLGVWDSTPAAAAFGPADEPPEEDWRVDLPAADPAAVLADRAAALGSAEDGIREAEWRLAAFTDSADAGGAPAAFAVGPGGPEEELAAWVRAVTAPPDFQPSFGWFGRLDDAAQEAWDFLRQTAQSLTAAARVETAVAGVVVARTTVGWRGSATTAWRAATDLNQATAHSQSLALALSSRRAWVRLAAILVGGAAGLAARLATPGGWISAVPAVWRFVWRVIAEVRVVRAAGRSAD
jgi:hypothetical protein